MLSRNRSGRHLDLILTEFAQLENVSLKTAVVMVMMVITNLR